MTNYLQSAFGAWRAGRLADAEAHCRTALNTAPDNADALQLMGAIYGSRQQHSQAADFFRRALTSRPTDVALRKNLARAYLQESDFTAAESVLKEGLAAQADDSLWGMLAVLYARSGQTAAGIEACENAIRLNPKNPGHLFGLAEFRRREGDRDGAIQALRQALKIDPANQAALNNLAGLELYSGNFLEALHAIQRLLSINPKSAQAQCNLAALLSIAGDLEQAVVALRNALAIEPGLSRAKQQLTIYLMQTGAIDEAEKLARELLQDDHSEHSRALGLLVKVLERRKRVTEAHELLQQLPEEDLLIPDLAITKAVVQDQLGETRQAVETLRRSMDEHEMAATEGIGCHFVMGGFLDKLEEFDQAFHHYAIGNRNRKRAILQILQDEDDEPDILATLKDLFPEDRYASFTPVGSPSEVPVFIVGMPRSGTTLSEQILASHPDVYGAGELNLLMKVIADSYGKRQAEPGKLLIGELDKYSNERGLIPKDWYHLNDSQVQAVADQYLQPVRQKSPQAKRITDKMPYNYFVVPIIHRLFPKARIIHCRRHPLDTCLSCFFQNFTSGNQFSFELEELGKYYRQYVEVMDYWAKLGIPMFDAHYEELISAPEDQIRSMLDFCGLEWDDRCLEFHRNKRTVNTASYQQVRVPLYKSSVDRWKNYRQHLQPLIEQLSDILDPESVGI